MQEGKTNNLKVMAKAAKNRLKTGFWSNYGSEVNHFAEIAKANGVKTSEIVEFYEAINSQKVTVNSYDDFYAKVKKMLDEEGEVSDAIGRLIDKEIYDGLEYEGQQRYILELSGKYREAVKKYNMEKEIACGAVKNS